MNKEAVFRDLGVTDYEPVYHSMQDFTEHRDANTVDEIWFTEHNPVFTQGQAGKAEHVLAPGDIPVVQTDRGGQVTYHGPGQITGYLMFDLERMRVSVRDLVTGIEQACIETLRTYDIESAARRDAPGVYVDGAKIASLGLRVRRGMTYHGLAMNVNMDLTPWQFINPCGLSGIEMTQIANFQPDVSLQDVQVTLKDKLGEIYGLTFCTSDSRLAGIA